MSNDKIKFGDLHWSIQVVVIIGWINIIVFALGFINGLMRLLGG